MKNIKVEKHIDCDGDTYYEARWVGISKDIILVGGGATPEEAIAELKENAKILVEYLKGEIENEP